MEVRLARQGHGIDGLKGIELLQLWSVDGISKLQQPDRLIVVLSGVDLEELPRSTVKDLFAKDLSSVHDLDIETRSLHGHRHFTAWEWILTYKVAIDPEGERLKKEDAPLKKMIGCTLMWWNDDDKIIRDHEYLQAKE